MLFNTQPPEESAAAFMHYAIADGSRAPTGFGRLIFTHAVLKPLEIRQYSLRALPCLSKKLALSKLQSTCRCQFSGDFRLSSMQMG